MFLVKLLLAAGIIFGLLYAVNCIHREFSRRKSGGLVVAVMKKAQHDVPNEMEKFIADYRAQTARAVISGTAVDPGTEHTLGIDISNPALTPVAEGPKRLVFLLLKTTLADHHLFPNARLGDFVQGVSNHLLAQRVDFLICDRAFKPLAVVDIADHENSAQQARSELLSKLGPRYVKLAPGSLPKPHQIRVLVLGAASAAAG